MTSDLESFKAKLRSTAKEKKRDPADLWQLLTLERFFVFYRLLPKGFSRVFAGVCEDSILFQEGLRHDSYI